MPATIVQSNSGTTAGAGSVTASLPAGTTLGNHLIIAVTAYFNLAGPAGFNTDKAVDHAGLVNSVGLWSKATAAGETSWVFTQGGTTGGVWWAAEWSGLATTPLDVTASDAGSSGATDTAIPTGTTATTAEATELAIAVVATESTNATPVTFSAWTNSFVEIADLGNTAAQARALGVARRDLVATGTYTTTATASAPCWNDGVIATYKLAPVAVAPPPRSPLRRIRTLLVR